MLVRSLVVLVFSSTLIPASYGRTLNEGLSLSKRINSTEIIPSPLVIPPSEYFDGDDGDWSSFALRVGTPAQDVRVLVSTNSPETMVVLSSGCSSAAMNPVPNNCANSRGGLFDPDTSSTWQEQGLFGINQDGVGFEANLGYSQNASYGLETLGLGFVAGGSGGPTMQSQTVAGIETASPFYLGIFGLSTQPVNYTNIGNSSAPSYFSSLRAQNLIPSLSWSYTAGAKYRLKAGQYAQLIFGGFDTSRFTPNTAAFTLAGDVNRDIVVAIQSIIYSGTTQTTLLSSPTYAFIESTDPNFWLPEAACQAFEQAFGIQKDSATGLYLINATHYSQLQAANPQVTFSLANSLSGGETVNIVLPFNAFALSASYPFTPNDTYYFPLKTAANDTQNTLGRAFLQEAYLTVDYERGNFSVSQCLWEDGAVTQLTAILSPSYSNNAPFTSLPPQPSSKPVGAGLIAGTIVAVLVALSAVGTLIFYLLRLRNRRTSTTEDVAYTHLDRPDDDKKSVLYPASPVQIFQLPAHDNREGDYYTEVSQIESQRRAANTPEIAGTSMYELQGSQPMRVELDDTRSPERLSPLSATTRGPSSGVSSRTNSPLSYYRSI